MSVSLISCSTNNTREIPSCILFETYSQDSDKIQIAAELVDENLDEVYALEIFAPVFHSAIVFKKTHLPSSLKVNLRNGLIDSLSEEETKIVENIDILGITEMIESDNMKSHGPSSFWSYSFYKFEFGKLSYQGSKVAYRIPNELKEVNNMKEIVGMLDYSHDTRGSCNKKE